MKKLSLKTIIGGIVVLGTCIAGGVFVARKSNGKSKFTILGCAD